MLTPLPMIKFGGLVIRTLTKPMANAVKARSKTHPTLKSFCHSIGQKQHDWLYRFHMTYRGIGNYTVKPLPMDQAVENGANVIGEIIVFSVALGVASFEYTRSTNNSKVKEALQQQKEMEKEKKLETRLEHLEEKLIWLETQLAGVGQILEKELSSRLAEEKRGNLFENPSKYPGALRKNP